MRLKLKLGEFLSLLQNKDKTSERTFDALKAERQNLKSLLDSIIDVSSPILDVEKLNYPKVTRKEILSGYNQIIQNGNSNQNKLRSFHADNNSIRRYISDLLKKLIRISDGDTQENLKTLLLDNRLKN